MFVPYYPDVVKVAEAMNVEILESYVPDSRLHEIINNPVTEGIDEGWPPVPSVTPGRHGHPG